MRKSPKEQIFYRVIALLATLFDFGDQTWWGYDPPRFQILVSINKWCMRILASCSLLSQIFYMYFFYSKIPFHVKGVMFAMIQANGLFTTLQLSSKRKSYIDIMKKLMTKIHLNNFVEEGEYIRKILVKAEKNTRFASHFTSIFLSVDGVIWCLITGYNSIHNRQIVENSNKTIQFETTLYFVLPFDYEHNFNFWIIVHLVNTFLTLSGGSVIAFHLCMCYIFIFQLIGHVEILNYKIRTSFLGVLTEDETRERLVNVIRYHNFVLQLYKDIQSAFGIHVSAFYFYNFIADSLLMYMIMMSGDTSSHFTYGTMYLGFVGGLIMMSFSLEEISKQSDSLADLVYDLEWYKMSVSNRKVLLLLLMRIQQPLVFMGAGGVKTGVNLMLSILKSSFSYYTVLKSGTKS